jgi:RimJ/RimL family protein N-acetyltransferase
LITYRGPVTDAARAEPDPLPMRTDRLVIRRFELADAAVLAAYRSDPDVARYQSWSPPVSLADAEELVRWLQEEADPRRPGWYQYAVARCEDGRMVGDVGVRLHENRMQAELGFTLAPAWQGHGYAAEAVGRVLGYLFGDLGLHRVSAECDLRNVRSARLLERLGFHREGLRPEHTWIKGEWTDDLLFGLLAHDWRLGHPR